MRNRFRHWRQALLVPGAWIYIPLVVFLAGFAYWAVASETDYSFYWRDPAAIVNTGPWIGLFSNVGVFICWIAAVIAVFTALVLRRASGQVRTVQFFLASGLLSGVLALDDFFMIHEWVVPTYLPLSDDALLGVYGIAGAVVVYSFRREIRRTRYPILLLAGICFSVSTLLDVAGVEWFEKRGVPTRLAWNLEYVVEDGLKLMGLIAWTQYFTLTCYEALASLIPGSSVPASVDVVEESNERVEVG